MRFVMIAFVVGMMSNVALGGEYRIFCESADDELPHYSFNFYPYSDDEPEGTAVMTLDRGLVLDLKQYADIEIEILEDVVRIEYSDGNIEFDNTDEFENPGNVKHIGGGIALVEDLLCYRTSGEL